MAKISLIRDNLICALLVLFLTIPSICHSQEYQQVEYVMGSFLNITVNLNSNNQEEVKKRVNQAFDLARFYDELLSNYKPHSELSLFNELPKGVEIYPTQEFYDFLKFCFKSNKSYPNFDIGLYRLFEIWKDGGKNNKLPNEEQVKKGLSASLVKNIVFNNKDRSLIKINNLKLDAGGIGKGYALDKIKDLFTKNNIQNYLIDFGMSSILGMGHNKHNLPWKIKVKFNEEEDGQVIELNNQCYSGSTSFGQGFLISGIKYSHIISPRTGRPILSLTLKTAGKVKLKSSNAYSLNQSCGLAEIESKNKLFP